MKLKRISDSEMNKPTTNKELELHYGRWDVLLHRQLDSCQKQVDEMVGEIFREIEKLDITAPYIQNSKQPQQLLSISFKKWQALKQKWEVK